MNLDQTFHALSDPARRDLIVTLSKGPQTAGALAAPHNISRPAISRHLRVLRDAGLVTAEIHGRHHWYHLNTMPINDIQQWLDEVSSIWKEGLQALKAYVEEDE
ncbi:metalloregulator ArsR/SmtB family transcription factor [Chloroflexi bacterium TSY]|nr:metalloregulator ArsR/SmtB family transcription factor [Chloroflexi bacterium TSY]